MPTKPETLLVMPYTGKYCEVIFDNQAYKIWKVHPSSPNSYGTPIPYDIGVYFLGKVPPVITLVPNIKGGKSISPLLEEDQQKIKESLSRGFVGGFKNYNTKVSDVSAKSEDPAVLKKTLEMLEAQIAKNNTLQSQVASLSSRLESLEKAGSSE